MRRLLAAVLTAAVLLSARAEDAPRTGEAPPAPAISADKLVGTWTRTETEGPEKGLTVTQTFAKDGTFKARLVAPKGRKIEGAEERLDLTGTWKLDGDQVEFMMTRMGMKVTRKLRVVKVTEDTLSEEAGATFDRAAKQTIVLTREWKRVQPASVR